MNQLQAQEQQQRQQYMQNQQYNSDPFQDCLIKFNEHMTPVNNQNNNNRIKIIPNPTNNYDQPYGGQNFPQRQENNFFPQQVTPQTQISNPQPQSDQCLRSLTAYQRVFKTNKDGIVVCNFEDVKKYMESETRTEITPKRCSGIKRIVEIDHKM